MSRAAPFLVAALGILLLCVMDALIKAAAAAGAPTAQLVLMRYLCGLPFVLAIVAFQRPAWPDAAMTKANALRGCVIVVSAFLFFYALSTLPLADAVALAFLSPLFLAIFASLILGEKLSAAVAVAILVGLLGMAVIVWGKSGTGVFADARLLGVMAAVGCAVSYALSMVLLRERAQSDPLSLILLFQTAMPLILIAPAALWVWTPADAWTWTLFAGIGALGASGHACLAWSYKRATAGPLGVLEYTALVWAAGLGYVWFGEVPLWTTWVGAGLIVAACLWVATRRADEKCMA